MVIHTSIEEMPYFLTRSSSFQQSSCDDIALNLIGDLDSQEELCIAHITFHTIVLCLRISTQDLSGFDWYTVRPVEGYMKTTNFLIVQQSGPRAHGIVYDGPGQGI